MRLLLNRIFNYNLAELIRLTFSSLKAFTADLSNCIQILLDLLLKTFPFSPPRYFIKGLAIFE